MDTTTKVKQPKDPKKKGFTSMLKHVLGGEFLLSRQMRSWYYYIFFVLFLVALLVVSEQSITNKKKKVAKLESKYRIEISKLKANNQFIPYEENKILIQKLQDKGFVVDDNHNYTIRVKAQDEPKKIRIFKRNRKNAKRTEEKQQ